MCLKIKKIYFFVAVVCLMVGVLRIEPSYTLRQGKKENLSFTLFAQHLRGAVMYSRLEWLYILCWRGFQERMKSEF
jgi:hypothetical protein